MLKLNLLFLAGNKIKSMGHDLFGVSYTGPIPRVFFRLKTANFLSNTCINGYFYDAATLQMVVKENCKAPYVEPPTKPICDQFEKCPFGEKCCLLSKFQSKSPLELKRLEHNNSDSEVDAISYNNNPNIEYLLERFSWFPNLKVYDASNCAVREIFWENFYTFDHLETLNLANNQISTFFRMQYKRHFKNVNLGNNLKIFLTFKQTFEKNCRK